ncbi:SusC/RagA family TonB-linked outer membrane protein [Bacteroidia bacterium]|nr:SusC/RagA family TonB-linked outer membrane protein [Bacteroidia bacterium]
MGLAIAQTTKVKGVVVDESNEPIVGASVMVKGNTAIGTVTNIDGQFTLDVPASAKILIVKYLGMEDQEVNVAPDVKVILKTAESLLDEVIVIAYGTATKKSFTGSASVISSKSVEKRQASDVTKTLQGAVAGVSATSLSGQPGASSAIRIRGLASISAVSDPLYVIDGVPYEGSLNSLNTVDIENMTILKDAAANSMYGARGANGVVLITTKKGQTGKSKVTFETRFGVNTKALQAYDLVTDPGRYLALEWEALRNRAVADGNPNPNVWASDNLTSTTYGTGGYNPYGNVPGNEVIIDGKLNPSARLLYHDDWLTEPFSSGFRNEDVITISGGGEKTNYYMSAGFLTDEAYIPGSGFQRFTGRAKIDQTVTSWFKTGFNISYAKVLMDSPWSEDSAGAYANLFMFAQGIAPIYPIYQYDQTTGKPILDQFGKKIYDYGVTMGNRAYGSNGNPLSALENDIKNVDKDVTTALGFAEFSFLKDFKLMLNIGIENSNYFQNSYQTPIAGDALNVGGRNTRSSGKFFGMNAQQLLTWKRDFDNHSFDVLLGHESKRDQTNYLAAQKENFLIPDNPELNNAARLLDAGSYEDTYSLESYLSRIQYNYADKYYASASYRVDGSSRFHPDSRWGDFWSVGAAWRVSEESFLKNSEWINDLKLKASYGIQGNDRIGRNNAYEDQYSVVPQDGEIGISYIYRGNSKLRWEASGNFNAGFEFSFFDRFKGNIEYYIKKTSDLLYQKPLPPSMGTPTWTWENTMSMKNYGFELELNYDVVKTQDLLWTIGGNITSLNNKLLKLPEDRDPEGNGYRNGLYYYKVGNSIYDFYLYEYAGVDPATGMSLWYYDVKDEKGNVTESGVTPDYAKATYRENGKNAFNDYYGGLNTTLTWKGFDLGIYASYAIGGYTYDSQYAATMNNMDAPGSGIHKDVEKRRWTTPGQVTDVPKLQFGLQNQSAQSDRFLTSRSYFSLQNVTLGYTLPKQITNKLGIEKIRLYLVADELYLKSARQGFDPRLYIGGGSTYAYSALRSTSFGLNINF